MLTSADQPENSGGVAPRTASDHDAASIDGQRSPLDLRMDFDTRSVVLSATGELDAATAPRLAELLEPRLRTTLPTIVIDLSGLTFLGVAGLEVLATAFDRAGKRGITLSLVSAGRAVDVALAAGGLDSTVPCYSSVSAALEAAPGSRLDVVDGRPRLRSV